jgi:hypothetical protein
MGEGKRDYQAREMGRRYLGRDEKAIESRGITGAGNGAREMGTYTSTSLNVIKSTSFSSSAFGIAGRSCWTAVTVSFLLQHGGPK